MEEHEAKNSQEEPPADGAPQGLGRKVNRGPTFKLGGVPVQAKPIAQAMEDLEPLYLTLHEDKDERNNWQVRFHVKHSHWDCLCGTEDDARLLKGIYEHGMGSGEAIKMDEVLALHEKILPDGDFKPQTKHLQTRACTCRYSSTSMQAPSRANQGNLRLPRMATSRSSMQQTPPLNLNQNTPRSSLLRWCRTHPATNPGAKVTRKTGKLPRRRRRRRGKKRKQLRKKTGKSYCRTVPRRRKRNARRRKRRDSRNRKEEE